jgi:hypothetical protein
MKTHSIVAWYYNVLWQVHANNSNKCMQKLPGLLREPHIHQAHRHGILQHNTCITSQQTQLYFHITITHTLSHSHTQTDTWPIIHTWQKHSQSNDKYKQHMYSHRLHPSHWRNNQSRTWPCARRFRGHSCTCWPLVRPVSNHTISYTTSVD